MTVARGQVWRVRLATTTRAVLVVESDAALSAFPDTALCMMIDETGGAPDTVVTVPVTSPVQGAAVAVDVTALTTKRITAGTFLGTVNDTVIARVASALRVVLDLHD
ncbi:type II toxin-antitoxin system PemK/MazF family toxin [Streptomyces sp. 4N509B]|uniref:type II toxin-antitoxin system PemK/MazF family toxin n=1 Tax=Streptomyces sp. 4N509B TaxID=3457413 RepID=UPI003FD21361